MKFTVVFNDKQEKRLEELAEALEMNKAQVVREALRILSAVVRGSAEGKSVGEVVGKLITVEPGDTTTLRPTAPAQPGAQRVANAEDNDSRSGV